MKTYQNLLLEYFFLIYILTFAESCNLKKTCSPCPVSPTINPNINFRLVDNTTNQDLFFGSGAKYDISEIKVHHIINGKADTAFLSANTNNQFFNLNIPTIHTIDTVTFQIGSQSVDTFLFFTNSPNKCCPFIIQLNSVSFDGNTIYENSDGLKIVTIKK